MTEQLLYRPEEVAALLRIGRTRVFELMRTGELPSVKIGTSRRITRRAVLTYVRRLERVARRAGGAASRTDDRRSFSAATGTGTAS